MAYIKTFIENVQIVSKLKFDEPSQKIVPKMKNWKMTTVVEATENGMQRHK